MKRCSMYISPIGLLFFFFLSVENLGSECLYRGQIALHSYCISHGNVNRVLVVSLSVCIYIGGNYS